MIVGFKTIILWEWCDIRFDSHSREAFTRKSSEIVKPSSGCTGTMDVVLKTLTRIITTLAILDKLDFAERYVLSSNVKLNTIYIYET
jgi:hypothetical protein